MKPMSPRPILSACVTAILVLTLGGVARGEKRPHTQGKPFVIEVKQGSKLEDENDVPLSDGIAKPLDDNPVSWNVRDFLSKLELRCGDKTLSVSDRRDDKDVYVIGTLKKIKKGDPGKLTIGVAHPERLTPGIYRGILRGQFSSDALSSALDCEWNIAIVVYGCRLVDLKSDRQQEEGKRPLRVGKPAALDLTVETIGCELGDGRLSLESSLPGSEQPPETLLDMKLPNDKPFDPRVRLDPLVRLHEDPTYICHPLWRDSVQSAIAQLETSVVQKNKQQQDILERTYHIRIAVPDCFQTGALKAKITWNQPPVSLASGGKAPTVLEKSQSVLPGIRLFPARCAVGELVHIFVVSDIDLSDKPTLLAVSPNGEEPIKLTLTRSGPRSGTGSAAVFHYESSFRPTSLGKWQVACPPNAKLPDSEQSVAAILGDGASINVCFQTTTSLREPLQVFVGPPPIWWPLVTNPNKGEGNTVYRSQAFVFAPDGNFLPGEIEFKPAGLFAQDDNRTPLNPDFEPKITFYDGAESSAPAEQFKVPPRGKLDLKVKVSVLGADGKLGRPDDPRHVPGFRNYRLRGMLTGVDSNNEKFERIIEVPLVVRVSTAWEYNRNIYLGAAFVVVLSSIVYGVQRRSRGPRRRRALALQPAVEHAGPEAGGYLDRSFALATPQEPSASVERQLDRTSNELPPAEQASRTPPEQLPAPSPRFSRASGDDDVYLDR
jgi:hypothetical protein